jgi:hypothetical protein
MGGVLRGECYVLRGSCCVSRSLLVTKHVTRNTIHYRLK